MARNNDPHDFIGAFKNLMHPQIPHHALNLIVLQIPVAAVNLQRFIGDIKSGIGNKALCHGRAFGAFGVIVIERAGGVIEHKAGGLQLGRHIRQLELYRLKIADAIAELFALARIGQRLVEGALGGAERTGRDI